MTDESWLCFNEDQNSRPRGRGLNKVYEEHTSKYVLPSGSRSLAEQFLSVETGVARILIELKYQSEAFFLIIKYNFYFLSISGYSHFDNHSDIKGKSAKHSKRLEFLIE